MALARLTAAALLLSLVAACGGGSLDGDVAGLKASYDSESWDEVVANAPAALERAQAESAKPATVWKIERYHVEALAGQGDGDAVLAKLAELTTSHPAKVDAILYAKLGNMVVKAPDGALAAVSVLDAGVKAFPENREGFNNLITAVKNSGDEAANAALAALGYL